MVALEGSGRELLEAIACGLGRPGDPRRLAWVVWSELEAAGHGVETRDQLAQAGFLVEWAGAWTLTPLAAELLGVEVREYGYDEHPAFASEALPEVSVVLRRQPGHRGLPGWVEAWAADPAPGPAEVACDEFMVNPWSGEKVLLFGSHPVKIDRRLARYTPRDRRIQRGRVFGSRRTG